MHRIHVTLPAALLLAGALARPAVGQVQYRPTPANLPPAQTQAVAQPTSAAPPPAPAYAPPPPYIYQGYQGPMNGYLTGVSSVIGAQGQYLQDYQSARMSAQQVEQEKIRTRAMLRAQERYEASLQPTAQDIADQRRERELRWARRDPPRTDIWSGDALNALLKAAGRIQSQGVRGPLVPLDPEVLRQINLSGGTSRGPSTVLRNGKPRWPLVLQEEIFTPERKEVERLLPVAAMEAREGDVQLATFRGLTAAVDRINGKIDAAAQNMSLQEIAQAQRYTGQLKDALSLLKDPNVANYFNGKWEAQGRDVGELIYNMTRNGLSFAPASETGRTAYQALYQAMATYDMGLTQLVRR
jgi:hypothetical protein